MKKDSRIEAIIDRIIIFSIVAITRIYISFNAWPFYTIGDETSAISIAALVAGYDWSDIVSHAGYYGIGYLFIYAPLFKMGLPAVLIYRIIVAGSAVILGISALICNKILVKFFPEISRLERVVISMVCGCMSFISTYQPSMRNEEILILLTWLIVYNAFFVLSEKQIRLHRIIIMFLCIYSLTVHTRAVTFIIIIFAVSFLAFILKQKMILNFFDMGICIAGYYAVKFLLKIYKHSIWVGRVTNSSVTSSVTKSLSRTSFDLLYVKSLVSIFLGQLFTGYTASGGILIISLVVLLIAIYDWVKNGNKEYTPIVVIGVMLTIGVFITIGGQMLSWGDNVYLGLVKGNKSWSYGYKAFTYLRYSGYLMPALFMIGFVLLIKYTDRWSIIAKVSTCIIAALSVAWYYLVFPYITKQKNFLFLPTTILSHNQKATADTWYMVFKLVALLAFLWLVFLRKRKNLVYLCVLLTIYSSAMRFCAFYNMQSFTEKRLYSYANAGTEFLNYIQDNSMNITDVYSVDLEKPKHHQIWYQYQFNCYSLHIIPNYPDETLDNVFLLTNGVIENEKVRGMEYTKLDSNEYLYYRGDRCKDIVTQYLASKEDI